MTFRIPPTARVDRRTTRRITATVACAAAVMLAACGSDKAGDTAGAADGGSDPVAEDTTGESEIDDADSTATDTTGESEIDAAATDSPEDPTTGSDDADSGLVENQPVEVAGAPLIPLPDGADDPAVGVDAPVLTGASFDGTTIEIGGSTDGPTMVVFLAHWCPHCNDEIPEILELEADGRVPDGLDIVGVSTAVAADRPNYPPSQWVVDTGWNYPTMADDEIGTAIATYGGTSFPFIVVLDAEGAVLARHAGQSSADEILEFLTSALG